MKVLIYKRTHTGDPDASGHFGVYRCMGQVRSWGFDAVIGIGGIGPEPVSQGIARRITWVGVAPTRTGVASDSYPVLTFERFRLLDGKGPWLEKLAPRLAKRMYAKAGVRFLIREADDEIRAILKLAKKVTAPSKQHAETAAADICKKRCQNGNRRTSRRRTC